METNTQERVQQSEQPSQQMLPQIAQPQAPKVVKQIAITWYEGNQAPRVDINGMPLEASPLILRKLANDLEKQYLMS
jgi:hypothetical protein